MKKIIALALILALATVSNAALSLTTTTNQVTPGQATTIGVVGDGVTPSPISCWIIPNAPATASGGFVVFPPPNGVITIYRLGDGSGIIEDFIRPGGFSNATTAIEIDLYSSPLAGSLVTGINLRPDISSGNLSLYLTNDDLSATYSIKNITVPEPMTLALLGLGAILIRRK